MNLEVCFSVGGRSASPSAVFVAKLKVLWINEEGFFNKHQTTEQSPYRPVEMRSDRKLVVFGFPHDPKVASEGGSKCIRRSTP